MKLLNILNKVIEYSFYLIFFLVPLALTGDTSELFEFNKLWVTFILTIVIGAAWISKSIIKKEIRIQRTPLDIPIGLFLASQVLSTIISLDTHISLWGYYSRFNGGLLSILSYIFLYYAFVSNFKDIEENYRQEGAFKFSQIILFIVATVVFFGGNFLSSLFVKTAIPGGFPLQMTISLVSAIAALAIFIKAAPTGLIKRSIYAILTSGALVVLWGIPSRLGYDPTCLLFRGSLDVACWTADFQPKIRVFSTMGQPDWFAAYLVVLIPVCIGILLNFVHGKKLFEKSKNLFTNSNLIFSISLIVFIAASYLMILYTTSRSAVLAIWITTALLIGYYAVFYLKPKFDKKKLNLDFKITIAVVIIFAAITFFAGQPFSQFNKFTWNGISSHFVTQPKNPSKTTPKKSAPEPAAPKSTGELGGTDSGIIRSYVWKGAFSIWKNYPILGSGVETYAFAYYRFRPVGHNLTSEWNFLYNKAHNEFLNYLATTGTLGILTYLGMIGTFVYFLIKFLSKSLKQPTQNDLLIYALLMGYLGILITNFFGFSVVMINILFYIIPAFVFIVAKMINFDKTYGFSFSKNQKQTYSISSPQKGLLIISSIVAVYLIFVLVRFWQADRYYYLGFNFDRSGDYQRAYPYLKLAVDTRPSEPTFRDEFALNNAVVASSIIYQNQSKPDQKNLTLAKQLVDSAVKDSNKVTSEHPNNIVFLKTRVRIFYTLSQVDPSYLPLTLDTIKKTAVIAPTDADVSYNLGILYGQTGDLKKGISVLENTVKLKPDYQGGNAYYALGIFYHQLAVDSKGKVVNPAFAKKAIDEMQYKITNFGSNEQAQAAIKLWTQAQP